MSGAEDEDQIDSAFYPGFKRRVKTETEERPESYQAMLQQMQDRMGKMEEKYETKCQCGRSPSSVCPATFQPDVDSHHEAPR